MIAAVAAVFASAQVAAATETVRHTGAAGRPVRGSRMWCSTSPPRRQRRAAVDDVASPPSLIVTTWLGPSAGSPGGAVLSCTRIRHPPSGGSPATAVSPPRLTRTPRWRSEEHTSELQSLRHLVCRLLLEKKKKKQKAPFWEDKHENRRHPAK